MYFYKNTKINLILCSLIIGLVCIPIYYRILWNSPNIFIGSDPQIKYYQTIQILNQGISKEIFQCLYPAKEFGFSITKIPLGYPWAFIKDNSNCFFQYPLFMPLVHEALAITTSKNLVTFFPILVFFLNIIVVFFILRKLEVGTTLSLFGTFFIHSLSAIFISSLDYSELTLVNLLFLLTLFLSLKFQNSTNRFIPICIGFIISLLFQIRPEFLIASVFFYSTYFFFSANRIVFFNHLLLVCLSLGIMTSAFSFFNHATYGHFLGMRGWNTLNDASQNIFRNYTKDWISDLWGSDIKVGIFKGYPVLLLPIFLTGVHLFGKFQIDRFGKAFLYSGGAFVLLLPILSPYRAGVGILGLRYYESGIYLLLIGFFVFLGKADFRKEQHIHLGIALLVLVLSYFGYKSDLSAIKQWSGGVRMYQSILEQIAAAKPQLIVHRGLSISYLMGNSYLNYPQIAIYNQEDWNSIQENLTERQFNRILFLYWEGNQMVKEEFPFTIWNEKFDINFILDPGMGWNEEKIKLSHIEGLLLHRK